MRLNRRTCINRIACCTFGVSSAFYFPVGRWSNACTHDLQGFEAEFPSMGSNINLRWFSKSTNQDRIVQIASQIADQWCNVMSDYDPKSEAMVACSKADSGNWVQVSNELWSVIQMCDQWNRWSNGAFDAALGSITRLRRQRKPAEKSQWEDARKKSGWNFLELDDVKHAIRFAKPGVRLDFGAIGKGIVVDRIAEKLQEIEIEQYVVNASGNMRIGKAPRDTEGWPIAIDVPATGASDISNGLMRMRMSQCGISTSGDRWQRFPDAPGISKIDYSSHIIDPKTNSGVVGHQSVTIIAENATDADAASTATCVRASADLAGWLQKLSEEKPKLRVIVLLQDESSETVRMISNAPDFSTVK